MILCEKKHTPGLSRIAGLSILAALILSIFTGCGRRAPQAKQADSQTVSITASFYPLYIMLLNITAQVPDVQVSLLAPAETGCLHDYQLTTSDMKSIESCDILVVNGAGMEDFLEKALAVKKDHTIIASKDFPLTDDNAHVWVSVKGALHEVRQITQGLCALDPSHEAQYKANGSAYEEKLMQLGEQMHRKLDRFAGARIITFHEAFPYFASEFNLNLVTVIEREAGTEPSARELAQLVQTVNGAKAEGSIIALFAEPQYSSSAAEVIASETGCKVGELDPAVNGALTADAYISAMQRNCAVLEEFLQ